MLILYSPVTFGHVGVFLYMCEGQGGGANRGAKLLPLYLYNARSHALGEEQEDAVSEVSAAAAVWSFSSRER